MSRRLPGSLLLIALLLGLLYSSSVQAESRGVDLGQVLVRVSPLTLLLKNEVTVKVGEFTCQVINGNDPASLCSNLPPGDYQVSAYSAGYLVWPPHYDITIAGGAEDSGDAPDKANQAGDFYFNFYENNHQIYMPDLQVAP